MKHAIVAGALLALGCAVGSAAMAEDNDTGFYAGAGIGRFKFDSDVDNFSDFDDELQGFGLNDKDNAWKVFAGYRFMKFLSAEVDYIDFGRPKDNFSANGTDGDFSLELSGFAPYVVGTLPLGPVELSGKVGYLFYDRKVRVNFNDPDIDSHSNSNEEDWIWGGGLGVTVFDHLNVKVEYEEVNVSHGADASAYWLTGAWRF